MMGLGIFGRILYFQRIVSSSSPMAVFGTAVLFVIAAQRRMFATGVLRFVPTFNVT